MDGRAERIPHGEEAETMGKVARCATLKENERDTRVSCVSLRVRGRVCARPMIIDRKRKVIGGGTGVSLPLPRCDYE